MRVAGSAASGRRIFAAKDLRLCRSHAAAGKQKGLGFGNGDIGGTTGFVKNLPEFKRAAGAPWIQNDDLTIFDMRSTGQGYIAVGRGRKYYHDELDSIECFSHVARHTLQVSNILSPIFKGDLDTSTHGNRLDVFVGAVVQANRIPMHCQVSRHRFSTVTCSDNTDFKFFPVSHAGPHSVQAKALTSKDG